MFRANVTLAVDNSKPTDGIIARSAYNGHVLWKRKTADDFGTFGSLLVATPDVVYVKDGNGVLCLDAETGTERKRFSLSRDPQIECRWLMLQDGVLVAVLGQRPHLPSLRRLPDSLTDSTEGVGDTKEYGNVPHHFAVQQNWFQNYDRGTELVAQDALSGQELWRLPVPGIDPAKTAIAADRLFFYADRVLCVLPRSEDGQGDLEDRCPHRQEAAGHGMELHLHDHREGGRLGITRRVRDQFLQGRSLPGLCRQGRKDPLGRRAWAHHADVSLGRDVQVGENGLPDPARRQDPRPGRDPLRSPKWKTDRRQTTYFLPGLRFLLRLDACRPWHVRHRLRP